MKRTQKVIYALGWLLLQRAIWGRVLSDHSPQPATQPLVAFTTPPPAPFLPQLAASLNCGVNKIKREQRNSSGLFSNSFGLREALKRQQEVRPSCRERGTGQGKPNLKTAGQWKTLAAAAAALQQLKVAQGSLKQLAIVIWPGDLIYATNYFKSFPAAILAQMRKNVLLSASRSSPCASHSRATLWGLQSQTICKCVLYSNIFSMPVGRN